MSLELFIIDVDGTMTDSGIYYDSLGNEIKKFSTRDAAGIFAVRKAGARVMTLSGRECPAVEKRMKELGVDYLYQDIHRKADFIKAFCDETGIGLQNTAYIGDDLNDLAAMKLCGFAGCPADSCPEVKKAADYVSSVPGGAGAVRDIVEYIYRRQGIWDKLMAALYETGI